MRNKLVLGIVALGLFIAFGQLASAQTNPPPVSATTDLVTRTGTVYHHFHIEKADATGLLISYKLEDGGMGITRVSFDVLPENLQNQYGYDPKNAPTPADPSAPPPRVVKPIPSQDTTAGGN
jgi:hypothetical protein